MARASEQFRQSDVTRWGIITLVTAAIAVMSANVSALLPQSLLSGLHKTRIEGASVEQLRIQVGNMRNALQDLRRESDVLSARIDLGEQQGGDVTRRVGALEVSVPNLLELVPAGRPVDPSTTAAIDAPPTEVRDVDGGSIATRQQTMAELQAAEAQPIPARLADLPAARAAGERAYGVALGRAVSADGVSAAWRDLDMKLGPLLFGLTPLLAEESGSSDKRLVVGPITELAEATAFCGRLERISVACMPVPFAGTPLDQ